MYRYRNVRLFPFNLVLLFTIICFQYSDAQTLITQETFDEAVGSITGTMSNGEAWDATNFNNCDSDPGTWGVNPAGRFEVIDIEGFNCCDISGNPNPAGQFGDSGNTIVFGPIDISAYQGISFAFEFIPTGNFECVPVDFDGLDCPTNPVPYCKGGNDQVIFAYSIDGGPEEVYAFYCGDMFCHGQELFCGDVSGSELTIVIYLGNQSPSETYELDNLEVYGYTNPYTNIDANPGMNVCEGGSVTLTENGGNGSSWSWEGPNNTTGSGSSWTIDDFQSGDVGTYYVTVTSPNGCEAVDSIELDILSISASFTQSGTDLCPGECITIDATLSGGTPPYDVNFSAQIPPFPPITQTETVDGGTFQMTICGEEGSALPSYNPATNTLTVGVELGNLFEISINTITNSGCTFDINQTLSLDLHDNPDAFTPPAITVCGNASGEATINLADYDNIVNGNTGSDVNWFEDMNLTTPAGPIVTTSSGSFWAIVVGQFCNSEPVELVITVGPAPDITDIPDKTVCNEYILPNITGSNLVNPLYFDETGGTGNSYVPGSTINTSGTYYIYDGSPGCDDEESFELTIILGPDIFDPGAAIACDSFILPMIDGVNLTGNEKFYTQTDGAGQSYEVGDVIYNTSTLYLYDVNGNCDDEEIISIFINESPSFDMPDTLSNCGSVTLPGFNGSNLSNSPIYASTSTGGAPTYVPGDVITSSGTIYLIDSKNNCDALDSIVIVLSAAANMPAIDDVEVCDFYVLPTIDVTPSNNPLYYTESVGQGTVYAAGDTIFSTTTLYAYDFDPTNPACFSEQSFIITILMVPTAGIDNNTNVCSNSIVDLDGLKDPNSTNGGSYWDINNTGTLNGTEVTVGANTDTLKFGYIVANTCGQDTAFLDLYVSTALTAGTDLTKNYCSGQLIDLDTVVTGDVGGIFKHDGTIIGSMINLDTLSEIPYGIIYVVGDGVTCPLDSIMIDLNIELQPNFEVKDTVTCDQFIIESAQGSNLTNNEIYSTEINGGGTILNVGDTLVSGQKIYLSDINACGALDSFEVTINSSSMTVINPTICAGDTLMVGSEVFYQGKTSGAVQFANISGCDSIVEVNLTFYPQDTVKMHQTLCFNQTIEVNGTVYSETNSTGMEIIKNGDQNGCDSIIDIQLTFSNVSLFEIHETYCPGTSIEVNGNVYNESNPMGKEELKTQNGCDSIIDVQLTFHEAATSVFNTMICPTDSVEINGTFYHKNNPVGTEVIVNGSSNQCDSTVNINLSFFDTERLINSTLCPEESIVVNGTTYDMSNPQGVEIFSTVGVTCDSIIYIDLSFSPVVSFVLDTTICEGDFFMKNGTMYNSDNKTGTETLTDASKNGCDSILIVQVTVDEAKNSLIQKTLCPGESETVNGVVYDASNPKGQEIIQSATGACDSVVNIDLSFYNVGVGTITSTHCIGEEITINGTIYNASNPSGTFSSLTTNGCDSVTNVTLSFVEFEVLVNLDGLDCSTGFNVLEVKSTNLNYNKLSYSLNQGASNTIDIPGTINVSKAGNNEIVFTTGTGCEDVHTFVTEEGYEPKSETIEIERGDNYQINVSKPSPNATITWTPTEGLNCSDCFNPLATPQVNTVYTYVIVDPSTGCEYSGTITIVVREQSNKFYIPTIFSPNNDGLNELFKLYSKKPVEYNLSVYDRWGNLMYYGERLNSGNNGQGWNGRFNNKRLNSGVYAYIVKVLSTDTTLSGSITISN